MARCLLVVVTIFLCFLSAGHAQKPSQENPAIAACGGRNLIETLPEAKKEELRQLATAIPNGDGVFWKIEKTGIKPSWLLGTIHTTDAKVINLKANVSEHLNKADRVILELASIGLSNNDSNRFMIDHMELNTYSGGQTLEKETPPDKREQIKAILEGRGLSYDLLASIKPWFITTFLQSPDCERHRVTSGLPVLDVHISQIARKNGISVFGLETMEEQLSTLATLPSSVQFEMLAKISPSEENARDQFETFIDYYLSEKIGYLMEIDRFLTDSPMDKEARKIFIEALLNKRNQNMADRAIPFIEEGNSFIAVGAAHLPGEKGLIELLRQKGYSVTREPLATLQ